ncbi:transposase family protein [Kovacikia minuta CCNUW1]|uniref:transposase family protein n=1 Tax=Kovacikia minuta TaxID=2931930 RepID=UPI001CCA8DD4|nr:transposase family protein [Kovacikia minuta]UBF24042.1 transposase family protein [Kovacikia minuta CCNUW1]
MQRIPTEILNLPGIEVEDYTDVAGQLILNVEARTTAAICPRCQQTSHHLHQNHWYLARDSSISGRTVFLKINRRQCKCQTCGKPFSETLNFIGNRCKQTDRFAQSTVQQVLHSDIHNVALVNDLTDEEVWYQISSIKRCNILVHPFRNRTEYFVDEVMETACGLHNFRLTHRQLKAA